MRQQQQQQRQRQAAGYAWQQQKQREMEAQRAQAQRLSQPSAGLDWQEGSQIGPLPTAAPRRRSCLGTVATVVGILLTVGLCLFVVALILGS
jgi:ferric-dicitrate binding protein FerR (iron transport regulator)